MLRLRDKVQFEKTDNVGQVIADPWYNNKFGKTA